MAATAPLAALPFRRLSEDDKALEFEIFHMDLRGNTKAVLKPDAALEIPRRQRRLFLEAETGTQSIATAHPVQTGAVLSKLRRYQTERRSLFGRLSVATAYSTRLRREKATKTERPGEIPVHSTLAVVLGEWRLRGWARFFGRRPGLDDLIAAAREGGMRDVGWALRRFHRDLDELGLRRRRHYDSRRTFISLALAGGARKDLLRWITHAPSDVFDGYTSPPWSSLCEQVACLRVALNEGKVVPFPPEAVGDGLETGAPSRGKPVGSA
jgi:hypothetical protein